VYDINNLPGFLVVGNQGESGVNSLSFDISGWADLYPAATYLITYTRYGESVIYPELSANVSVANGTLTWRPGTAVLDVDGQGTVVFHAMEGALEKRSAMTAMIVNPGHARIGNAPDPLVDYTEKWGSVDAVASRVDNSPDPTVSVTQDSTGTHFDFGIPNNSLMRDIENTRQNVTLNPDGTVAQIVHTDLDTDAVIRTDIVTYDGATVTQVRTLADGSTLTITTDTDTLEQTISNIVQGE
jgi:hypothetical protein